MLQNDVWIGFVARATLIAAFAAFGGVEAGTPSPAPLIGASTSAGSDAEAAAEDVSQSSGPYRLDVYWENDGTILKPNNTQDRHYTNGNALTLSHKPGWARKLAERAEPFAIDGRFDHTQSAAGYVLGHQMFTPQRLTAERLIKDDRPYAGYLYGGVYWQRANEHTLDHVELDVGVVGPLARGKQVQNLIHEYSGDRDPAGWDNQLDNEPTAQLFFRRQYRLPLHALWVEEERDPVWGVELLPKAELAAGTVHRYVEGGLMLRAGFNLPNDFGPGEIDDLAAATGLGEAATGWGGYAFAGVSGRAVEHNLFLAGNTFESSHGVDEEPLVGRFRAGVALKYQGRHWRIDGMFSQTFLTEEFKQQTGGDAFGQLRLAITRSF